MPRAPLNLLLAFVLAVTSFGAATARGSAPAKDKIVICAGHIVSVVFLDADGEPTVAPQLCPDAVSQFLMPVTEAPDIGFQRVAFDRVFWPGVALHVMSRAPVAMSARGPPLAVR